MRKTRGFTLVELLVVISIIALLLSILMPSLNKARKQAKKVMCLSNLNQWSLVWQMYTNDNRGKLPDGWVADPTNEKNVYWTHVLMRYYNNMKLRLCPEIKGFMVVNDVWAPSASNPWVAWGKWPEDGGATASYTEKGGYGSYGINNWVENHPSDPYHWKNVNVGGASNIPLFLECAWMNSSPYDTDAPPQYDGDPGGGGWGDIKRFCLNRHNGETNVLFMDSHSRHVGLKELWKLKWSRKFNTHNAYTRSTYRWPTWMNKFKNYN